MGDRVPPIRTPSGNQRCIASPIIRPKAAPILKMGITVPEGTGNVEAQIVVKNWNEKSFWIKDKHKNDWKTR